ncbi:MAG: hypothetical protein K6E54_03915 [Bacteroidaceae bacterium]|nr:hypothetical protein [Bacteroidaceae bacterium]
MRKSIMFACAMLMAIAANANSETKNSKETKTTTYTIAETKFDKNGNVNVVNVDAYEVAQIDVPARVRIIKGNNYGVNVVALDKQAEKSIRYTVKNGILRFYSRSAEVLDNNSVVINLVVPATPEIKTSADLDKYNLQ